jgi:tight adherence protein C
VTVALVAVAWGALAWRAAHTVAARASLRRRVHALRTEATVVSDTVRAERGARLLRLGAPGRVVASLLELRRRRRAERRIVAQLPVAVDLVRVAVQSGTTPYGALELAARSSPSAVARSLQRVMRGVALGAPFADALGAETIRTPALAPLTSALMIADRLGAPLAPRLERVAHEARRSLRQRAEARARTVPVRLLFPLVFLVLPAFGLLTVVPALVAGWHGI